jgi:ABC-type lipoprotein release transport system permease subunit
VKFTTLFLLALKYFFRYRRRYVFLFLAVAFGFTVITSITSLKAGMAKMLYLTAQAHYSGDLIVLGLEDKAEKRNYHLDDSAINEIYKAVENANLKPDRIVVRTNIMQDAVLYYHGAAVQLKYVSGADWNVEAEYFRSLDYEKPPEKALEEDSILISSPVARQLGIRQGDSLILEAETWQGQKNTGSFVVAGIVDDTTIFGYFKSYISKNALNKLLGYAAGECSMIGLFFNDRAGLDQKQAALQQELERHINTTPLLRNRDDFSRELAQSWGGLRVFILTLPVYLSEVSELLDAMNLLSYLLYIMLLVIIMVSAFVTYRLILYERTRELGTMRVIGFRERDITAVLILETIILVGISLLVGLLCTPVFIKGLSFTPITAIPSFEIFTRKGTLVSEYQWPTILLNTAAVFVVLLSGLGVPAFLSSGASLPGMLKSP